MNLTPTVILVIAGILTSLTALFLVVSYEVKLARRRRRMYLLGPDVIRVRSMEPVWRGAGRDPRLTIRTTDPPGVFRYDGVAVRPTPQSASPEEWTRLIHNIEVRLLPGGPAEARRSPSRSGLFPAKP